MKSLLIALILSNALVPKAPDQPSSVIDSLILFCLNDIKGTENSYRTLRSFYVVKNQATEKLDLTSIAPVLDINSGIPWYIRRSIRKKHYVPIIVVSYELYQDRIIITLDHQSIIKRKGKIMFACGDWSYYTFDYMTSQNWEFTSMIIRRK